MTVRLSCEAIRALLHGSESGPSRMLDYEIHRCLSGRDGGDAPRYTDPVSGLSYLYRAIYALFPEAEVNVSQTGSALTCLVMIEGEIVYHSTAFKSHAHVLIDALMHMKEAWDAAVAEVGETATDGSTHERSAALA